MLIYYHMSFSIHSIAEASKDLGVGKETLRKRIRSACLVTHKIGNVELITGDELEILKNMQEPRVGRPRKGGT